MQEEELYHWWQYYGRSRKTIFSQGRRLRVLNSGILNTSRGPDFTAARFELDGIIYQGDVECHTKTMDWYAHNHHLDKAYRQVVLHLVEQSDISVPVRSQWCQQPIYTLSLPRPLNSAVDPEKYCLPGEDYLKNLKSNLIRLALDRFEQKVRIFINALNERNYNEIFYIYFFRSLGYPANANTFQLLAEQLNWVWLMRNKNEFSQNHRKLFAVYAGLAGFIPRVSRDNYSQSIERLYEEYNYLLPGQSFDPEGWQYAGVRPNNHPHSRLAAGLQILIHYNFELLGKLISLLQERREYHSTQRGITALFKLKPEAYWSQHYALGKARQGSLVWTSMGEARVAELLINVFLPLAAAQARLSGSEGYNAYIQSFYLSLPLISEYGCFHRHIAWSEECFKALPVQAVNQSLLLLKSAYCHQLLCGQCPLQRCSSGIKSKIIDKKIKNI